jgi:ADP-ribose pyrophosphatase
MRLRVVREREIYRGRVVRLLEKDFVLPNGRKTTFGVVQHPGAVAVVPVFENGDVLLLRQFRPTINEELYEIPAGTLEPGESPLSTAKRAKTWAKICEFYSAPGFCTELLHVYEARGLSPATAEKDEDEILEPLRMSIKDALKLIERRKIRDAKSIAGLLVHEQRRKKQKPR